MKKSLLVFIIGLALVGGCTAYGSVGGAVGTPPVAAGRADIDIGFFYDYLAPFGSWVEFSPWGYVWCPSGIGFGWNPYEFGQWLWTDDGWFWDSDYDWGWAPFHYGRWGWDGDLGWFWVPGITWGPAWVSWCWNDLYVGWAPIPPGFEFEAGIGFSVFPDIPFRNWCFVDGRHFLDRDLDRAIVPFERNRTILANVSDRLTPSFERGRIFNAGVRVDDVRRWTGRSVSTYRLENGDRPGAQMAGANAVRVYRPGVSPNEEARPRTFLPRDEATRRVPEMRMGQQGRVGPGGRRAPMSLEERHNQESQILRQTQERERQTMMERQRNEAARAASQAERQRINREYQQKMQEMQQRHTEEMNQMMQRHQEEQQRSGGSPRRK